MNELGQDEHPKKESIHQKTKERTGVRDKGHGEHGHCRGRRDMGMREPMNIDKQHHPSTHCLAQRATIILLLLSLDDFVVVVVVVYNKHHPPLLLCLRPCNYPPFHSLGECPSSLWSVDGPFHTFVICWVYENASEA